MGWFSLKAVKRGGGLGHGKMDASLEVVGFFGDLGGKIEQITNKYPGHWGGWNLKNGSKVLEVKGISTKRIVLMESFGMKKGTWVYS